MVLKHLILSFSAIQCNGVYILHILRFCFILLVFFLCFLWCFCVCGFVCDNHNVLFFCHPTSALFQTPQKKYTQKKNSTVSYLLTDPFLSVSKSAVNSFFSINNCIHSRLSLYANTSIDESG